MILRLRSARRLLTVCGVPLGVVQVGLLFLSIFLHGPGEEHALRLSALPAAFHHHEFHLIAAGAGSEGSAAPCSGCILERTPPAISTASGATSSPQASVHESRSRQSASPQASFSFTFSRAPPPR